MAKTFKSWDIDQGVLLPPSVQELVPARYRAHVVRDLVRESLDVSAILKPYTEDRGFPPYDPPHDGRLAAVGVESRALRLATNGEGL